LSTKPQQPQAKAPTSVIKNAAAAPVVFFDNAPTYGNFQGIIEVELAARLLVPRTDNQVAVELAAVAHLRSSPQAAMALRDALDKALAMAEKPVRLAS